MSKKEDKTVPAGGGVDGERDPLTVGATTYGEDVKGNSTFNDAPSAEEVQAVEAAEQTVVDQEERDAKASTPDVVLDEAEKTQADHEKEEVAKNGKTSDAKKS